MYQESHPGRALQEKFLMCSKHNGHDLDSYTALRSLIDDSAFSKRPSCIFLEPESSEAPAVLITLLTVLSQENQSHGQSYLDKLYSIEKQQAPAAVRAIVCELIARYFDFFEGADSVTSPRYRALHDNIYRTYLCSYEKYSPVDLRFYAFALLNKVDQAMLIPAPDADWGMRSKQMCSIAATCFPITTEMSEEDRTAIQEARFQFAEGHDPAYGYYGKDKDIAIFYYQLAEQLGNALANERQRALNAVHNEQSPIMDNAKKSEEREAPPAEISQIFTPVSKKDKKKDQKGQKGPKV